MTKKLSLVILKLKNANFKYPIYKSIVDIDKIISDRVPFGKNSFKYFFCYKDEL